MRADTKVASRLDRRLRALAGTFAAVLTAILVAVVTLPPGARAEDGLLIPRVPPSLTQPPPGYRVSGRGAIARAVQTPAAAREAHKARGLVAQPFLFGDRDWQVGFFRRGKEVVLVELDGVTGRINGVWTGPQIVWPLARGAHGPFARRLHTLMIIAGILFLIPFVEVKRLWRMRTLDLVALLSFGLSQYFAARGNIQTSVPLVYPPLLYLSGRLAWLALRPAPPEDRITWVPWRILLGGVVVLLALRYAYDLIDSQVNDVGYASVYGADSILNGLPIYDSSPGSGHLDTYGPIAYLTYVPFDLLMPLRNLEHAHAGAARLAAIVFDFATVAGLFALGRQLRPGDAGLRLGTVLAWGFATYPWTLFVLSENTNDGLVGMLLVFALLVFRSPAGRGAFLGLAAAAKFAPVALVGALARFQVEGRRRTLAYGGAIALAIVLPVWLYLPEGGVREFWDSTVGWQLSRSSPFSIWGLHPSWDWLHGPVSALVLAAAVAAAIVPRERTLPRLAAAAAAVLVATQITARHWYYFYLVWFAPYALVALFSRSYATSVRNSGSSEPKAVASKTS